MIFVFSKGFETTFETPEEAVAFSLLCELTMRKPKFDYLACTAKDHHNLQRLIYMAYEYLDVV